MTDAYVNVIVEAGAVTPAAEAIADIEAVDVVHLVTGEHDLVAQVSLDDADELPSVVADEIHTVSGVAETVTNVAYEP